MSFACRPNISVSGVRAPLTGGTSWATRIGSTTVTLTVGNDGTILATKTASASWNTGPVSESWYVPNEAVGSSFWVRATNTSGTPTSGTIGSWMQLNVIRQWTVTATGIGADKSWTCTIEIATDSGGSNIVTSGSFTCRATDET